MYSIVLELFMFYSAGRTPTTHVHRPPVRMQDAVLIRHVATHDEISKLAYSYWIAGGRREGTALSDWLQAERILTGK
jgi:hypothetical protein